MDSWKTALHNFPLLAERFNYFIEIGGQIEENEEINSLGIYWPNKRTNLPLIEFKGGLDLADQLTTIFHELSHFAYQPMYKGIKRNTFFEELRCHSEMFSFYVNEIRPLGLIGKEIEKRLDLSRKIGLASYIEIRYESI